MLAPRLSYVVKSAGTDTGTNGTVQLEFSEDSTGKSLDFRFEFGMSVIG